MLPMDEGVEVPLELRVTSSLLLTWEDLTVTVSMGIRKGRKSILQGLTGYARPGELLAVMGPSGCGKSTLLDALAGRLRPNSTQSGNILINGRKQDLAYGTLAYVMQDEALLATLTVEENLLYSAFLQLPSSMSRLQKKQRAETVMKDMGLIEARNTRVGGWGVRGLSGGQKRRLSICMEILGHPKILFLDEPTSGLDSAASWYVMSSIARQRGGKTIISTIHQPSAEVFNLFHQVCLLSSGRTVYFGPTHAVNEFFASNGYPCPALENPSDNFLKAINKDFDEDTDLVLAGRKPTEEVISDLISLYNSSEVYQEILRQVAEINKQKGSLLENRNQAAFTTQCSVLTRRSSLNMWRDIGYYWLRLAVNIVIALGIGSIYYDIGSSYTSIQARGAMLMFVTSFFTFMSIGGFPSFLEDVKVFQRESLNGHYSCIMFVAAHTLSSLPFLLLVSISPGAIAYFLTGLQNRTEQFIYFSSVIFACLMLVESLQMVVASIVPNFLTGLLTVTGIQAVMILSGGFFRVPSDLPKLLWKYPLYYISFHKYAYQGLYKNEFTGITFPADIHPGSPDRQKGEDILRDVWQVEMNHSKWVDLGVLLAMVVLYRLMCVVIVKINEKFKTAAGLSVLLQFCLRKKQNHIATLNSLV